MIAAPISRAEIINSTMQTKSKKLWSQQDYLMCLQTSDKTMISGIQNITESDNRLRTQKDSTRIHDSSLP